MSSSVVYAIGSPEHRFAKIGTTSNLAGRLAALQTSSPFPLHVLWQCQGGHELERTLHGHLSRFRVRGEWFDFGDTDPSDAIAEAMRRLDSRAFSADALLRFAAGRFTEARAERDALRKELAVAIRQADTDGVTQKDICEATGYTRQQVRRIVLAGDTEIAKPETTTEP
ncbi:GIY-YIG nuclease family protein [Streptomyces sp. B21-106]|uniref:GIY-YIG nuclease family protein n=1 Tax=Streptomyces sp. B21-106 TaxID=3039418 RepID=UPI002FF28CE0